MATEDQNIKITFDTNAAKAAQDVNKLRGSIDGATSASNENNQAVNQSDEAYNSFKTQLREANAELQKQIQLTGESSQETIKAAKAVADLKDQMGFAKDLADNFNPDQKMKALGAATQVAGTGLQGVTAGMALFGDQSQDTEKMLLKVQAAMAFSDAISNLSNLGDQFNIFKTVVKSAYASIIASKQAEISATEEAEVAQNRLNLSVLRNPYVIAAAAISALVVGIYAWTKASGEAAKKEEKVKEAVNLSRIATDNLAESIEDAKKSTSSSNDIEVLRARAYGATDEQIQKLIKSQKELAVSTSGTQAKQAYDNLIKSNENVRSAIKTGNEELIADAKESQKSAQELYKASNEAYNDAINEDIKFTLQSRIDANEKAKQAGEKAEEDAKKRREEAQKKAADEEKKRKEDAKKDREEDAAALLEFQKKVVDAEIQNKLDSDAVKQENLKNQSNEIARIEEEAANNSIEIEKNKADQKQAIEDSQLKAADSAVGFLQAIAGKNKLLQRAAIIAESALGIGKSIIANNTANVGALATPQAIATSGAAAAPVIAFNNVSTGLGIAANIAATAKALQAVGGGGGGSSSSTSTGTRSSAPPSVAFNNSAENQIGQSVAKTQAEQPPLKVTVLESDITTAQNNVNVLVKKNEF